MIGIDIVSIDRIKKMHEKFGDKFYDRFLCEDEKEFIKSPQKVQRKNQFCCSLKLLGCQQSKSISH